MTGVKAPAGVLGASVVLGNEVAQGTLPFTGVALGVYLVVGVSLIVAGLALRIAGKANG
jgi:hypothetical protein